MPEFQEFYNPYNPSNRLFTRTDIQAILDKHNCDFEIKNTKHYQTAMVHSSYVRRQEYVTPNGDKMKLANKPNECLSLFEESYERLEHLGDSILGSCVTIYLFKRYDTESEGFLTDLKKEIVCNETLGILSKEIGLDKFYIISRHNEDACAGRSNSKKLGDILEAFIGALYTDCENLQTVYSFVICLIEKYIDIPKILRSNRNYKEQLQKLVQAKFHRTPRYEIVSAATNMFTMAAVDEDGTQLGIGTAPTKKQAEQLAAKEAIEKFNK